MFLVVYPVSRLETVKVYPSIKIIILPRFIITFHTSDIHMAEVRVKFEKAHGNKLESNAWLVHAILDVVVDMRAPVIETTHAELLALEELIYVFTRRTDVRELLKRMSDVRRRISFLRQRLHCKRGILVSLVGRDWQQFLPAIKIPYLRDVYDHLARMLERLDVANELVSSLQNIYLSNVSIDVAEASNDTNNAMQSLSAVATIVLPMTFITGLFGMNVQVPWQSDRVTFTFDQTAPFWIILICMVCMAAGLVFYFRKREFL